VRTRVLIGIAAVVVGATFGWLTTPHLDPGRFGVSVERFEADGRGIDGPLEQIVVRSDDGSDGVVVLLHGRGGSPQDMLSDELFAALRDLGEEAPAVILPNGGEASYWHDRNSGEWATYLMEDVVPVAVGDHDLDGDKLAIGGISMGGFGALSLALELPDRFCAVGGHSPAVFRSFADAPAGAFDDEDDFERHDLLARVARAELDVPIWIDVGRDDPFRAAATDLAGLLDETGAEVTVTVPPGGHDDSYWRSHMDDYLSFYAEALQGC